MKNRFFGILLSLAMIMSNFVVVSAEESKLLSTGKPIDCGFIEADATTDTTIGTPDRMVDGDTSYTTWDKNEMWYLHSDGDHVWLNVDLQDTYTITSIGWYARYTNTLGNDFKGMVVYGANEADYSDKVELCNFSNDLSAQDVAVEIAQENIANYRYIRFERANSMGGQELLIYGYKDPATNADLSALSVEGYTFDVAFTSDNTEYTIFSNGFPTDNTVTVAATTEAATADVTGTGAVTVNNNGINEIPVTVTSEDGTTKTYTINFVVGSNVALTAASATHYVADTDTTKDALAMVNQTTDYKKNNGGATWKIATGNTGYMQVDLGKAYNLYQIVIHRANQGSLTKQAIPILASNDPTFASGTYETIGTTTKTETTVSTYDITTSASLDSTNKYRYVRIDKNTAIKAFDFYPVGVDIYTIKSPFGLESMTSAVEATEAVDVTFNDILASTIDTSKITVTKNGTKVSATVAAASDKLTISPNTAWQAGGIYKVTIPAETIVALDGRTTAEEIVQYFAVSTDKLEIVNFEISGDSLSISANNKLSDDLTITLWNVPLDGNVVSGTIEEDTTTVAAGGHYSKTMTIASEYAVYFFEDRANMKTILLPFTTAKGTAKTYTESTENITAEYTGSGIDVNGKSTSNEMSVFVLSEAAVNTSNVKAIAIAAVDNGTYAINIPLPDTFSGEYNVWASDGNAATPDKVTELPYVLSEAAKKIYTKQIADYTDKADVQDFFEYDTTATDPADEDNSKIISGIGIIADRPVTTQGLDAMYTAIAAVEASDTATYQEIVAQINEKIAIEIAKEKGVAYAIENHADILQIDTTGTIYTKASNSGLIDEAITRMETDYTDVESFNSKLQAALKITIFKNALDDTVAQTFVTDNNDFFGFNLTGDYTDLSPTHQQEAIVAAKPGDTIENMRELFNKAVKEKKGSNPISGGPMGGPGPIISGDPGSIGGDGSGTSSDVNADLPLPEVPVEVEPEEINFADIDESHWAYESIMKLAQEGIVNGTDGKFMPNNDIVREEFVKLLVVAAEIDAEGDINFSDVADDAWYREYVAAAKNSSIVNGISETQFGSGLKITRQDMAVMIYNTCKAIGITFDEQTDELTFDDSAEIKDYAAEAIKHLCAAGVINGRDNNMFAPTGNATRAEAATMICRMLDLIA